MENRIDEWRIKRGYTVDQLAEKIGTTRLYLQKLKKGERQLGEKWLKRLSAVLECNISDLLPESSYSEKQEVLENFHRAVLAECLEFMRNYLSNKEMPYNSEIAAIGLETLYKIRMKRAIDQMDADIILKGIIKN